MGWDTFYTWDDLLVIITGISGYNCGIQNWLMIAKFDYNDSNTSWVDWGDITIAFTGLETTENLEGLTFCSKMWQPWWLNPRGDLSPHIVFWGNHMVKRTKGRFIGKLTSNSWLKNILNHQMYVYHSANKDGWNIHWKGDQLSFESIFQALEFLGIFSIFSRSEPFHMVIPTDPLKGPSWAEAPRKRRQTKLRPGMVWCRGFFEDVENCLLYSLVD